MTQSNDLMSIAEELHWKGERAKDFPDLNEIELNMKLDEEWEIHQYTHR